jgi:Fe2+ or Zn2+ uptake regulation protein
MKHEHAHFDWSQKLRKAGLKATPIRLGILEVLSKGHKMLSIQEIFSALKQEKVDLATVYRCVRKFEKAGLIDSVSPWRFDCSL